MKKGILLTLLLLLTASMLFAQGPGLPCDGADPDDVACPLDSWVVGLAGVAMLFTCTHLMRKQKAAIKAA